MSTNLIQKIRKITKSGLVSIVAAGALALSACGTDTGTGESGGSGSSEVITCDPLSMQTGNDGLVSLWQEEGAYGVNMMTVYELADSCATADNCFKDKNSTPVKDYVMEHDLIPTDGVVWEADRSPATDGLDPRVFTQEDPFIIGYLPYMQKSSWGWSCDNQNQSQKYDWSFCAESQCTDENGYWVNGQYMKYDPNVCAKTNGFPNCIGKNQLDKTFTQYTLQSGKKYLARATFGFALGNGEGTEHTNYVQFCDQIVFTYQKP